MEQTMKQKKPVLPEEEKNRTRSRRNKRIKQFLPLYIMLLPGIVYLIINNYLPMGGLVIAFKKVNYAVGIFNSPWAGLSNFKFLFSNNDALNALRNTVLYNLGFILFGNILAITVAIALDCVKSKFLKRFSQVVILIPYLLSTVIVSYIVYAFLNPTNGFVNSSAVAGHRPYQMVQRTQILAGDLNHRLSVDVVWVQFYFVLFHDHRYRQIPI